MHVSGILFSRRSLIEREVLTYVRGKPLSMSDRRRQAYMTPAPDRLARADIEKFTRLKKLARNNGMQIFQPGSMYVCGDELKLLSWLATYQRASGLHTICHDDISLTLTIAYCAGVLSNVGLRLPPDGRFQRQDVVAS